MDTRKIDLHVHSTASDGTFSPTELVEEAKKSEIAAFALTDHDSISGIAEASTAAAAAGIELIPGIELSTEYQYGKNSREVHIVGLFIDPDHPALNAKLTEFITARDERNLKMIDNLAAEGFDISRESMRAYFGDCVMTRAHMARYLLDKGYIKDMNTAFSKYIGDDCRCYVPREKITPAQAVHLIRQSGGIAILAHPVLYHMNADLLDAMVAHLKAEGLSGIECIYSTYQSGDERNMKRLAKKYDLAISGGSDFHGTNKPRIQLGTGMGHLYIPYSVLDELKELHQTSIPSV